MTRNTGGGAVFFPLYMARRYLVSKKSHNIINIISWISIVGVAIGTMALIIVLSVFNGFDRLVVSLFSSFNSPVRITATRGKTFNYDSTLILRLRQVPGVAHVTEVIEEDALVKYRDNQAIVTLKGVGPEFSSFTGLDTMMAEGDFRLEDGDRDLAVPGLGVAGMLNASLGDYLNPLVVFVPRRDASLSGLPENAFRSAVIFPAGFFQVQYDYDVKYVIVPLRFARELVGYDRERTALEAGLAPGADAGKVQREIEKIAGPDFTVKNRYQQQEILYRIMVSEKNYIFMILTLTLVIATFNVIGTLSMLILDKRRDIAVLQSMGAGHRQVRGIFLLEGMLISLIGALLGLALGALLCWLQMRFGFIRLGGSDSSFVVNTYPVFMQAGDFVLVFSTVMLIGLLAAAYPVLHIRRAHIGEVRLD